MRENLAIVLMQKDEGALLQAWIDHHLAITSPEFIHIFDNGSTCPKTCKILKEANQRGIYVSLEFNRRSDFVRKGEIVCKAIQSIQASSERTFVIPLDCDEFLGLQSEDDTNVKFDKYSISNYLETLAEQKGYFRVKQHYFNNPHEPDLYHINSTPKKYFFGSSSLKSLDVGFHSPKLTDSSYQDLCSDTDLIAFHYHNKTFPIRRANAINKMRSRVNSFLDNDLRQYVGDGRHLIKDLRGIDKPVTPPTQCRTKAFLDHVQTSEIPFPHNLYQVSSLDESWKQHRAGKELRQELSVLRRSLYSFINRFDHLTTNVSSRDSVRLQKANGDIKQHYNTNHVLLRQLRKAIKSHYSARHIPNSKGPIVIVIRNNRSLANAYLATFIAGPRQAVVFDCRNFWTNTDTQLLTLTSSAVVADEENVILRHEAKCNSKLQKRLMLHFLMLAMPQSGFKNKGK